MKSETRSRLRLGQVRKKQTYSVYEEGRIMGGRRRRTRYKKTTSGVTGIF